MKSAIVTRCTIAERITATSGRTTGFDYLRIALAVMVIRAHCAGVVFGLNNATAKDSLNLMANNAAPVHPHFWEPIYWFIVPSFFALSGFLVAGSLMRSKTMLEFVMLRALRIVPALFVETILAALILGPLVTEFSIGRYFADRQFWHYPLNIVGDIHYTLPGVFLHNPTPRIVNLQLWTIPGELLCYLAIVVVSVIGLIRIRVAIPVVAIGYAVILTLSLFMSAHNHSAGLPLFAGVSLNTLLISFLAGVAIFLYRDLLPLNFPIFIGCSVASYALLWNGTYQYAASFPVAYCTVFLGLTDFRKTFVTATGDYSYGVYLYGYPVQQTVMYAFPTLNNTWFNFGTSLAVALLFASLSWHLVESQVLARRRTIIASVQTQFDRLSLATRRITQPR